jgi:hypothetical protein
MSLKEAQEVQEAQEAEITGLVKLKDKIEKMSVPQHVELFRIVKSNNVDFNENKNGIFINLSSTDCEVIKKLEEYIEYIEEQQHIINEQEKTKTEYIKEYFTCEDNVSAT